MNAKCKICGRICTIKAVYNHLRVKHNQGATLNKDYKLTNRKVTYKKAKRKDSPKQAFQLSTQTITIPAMITFSFMSGPIQIKPLVE